MRSMNDYAGASRWVIVSHALTERTKRVVEKLNPISSFLNNKVFTWLFHYVKSRFGPRHPFATYDTGSDVGIYGLTSKDRRDAVTVAIAADWGTYTAESVGIAKAIAEQNPDYTIHLGDTYFVGAPHEIVDNFKPGDSAWPYGAVGSFALSGNHEMYSNGDAYYEDLLSWMGICHPTRVVQKAGYFCLENEHWRIVGLDTGYRSVGVPFFEFFFAKADLKAEIIAWLRDDLKLDSDPRGLILLTHHQYNSAFDKQYRSAGRQLAQIIGKHRNVIWLWGHEHRFAMYGKYAVPHGISAYGRCIGNGGMPTGLVTNLPQKANESNLVLFDNRFRQKVSRTEIGHNGFAVLSLEGANLQIEYRDEQRLLVVEHWQFDAANKKIVGMSIVSHCSDLQQHQPLANAIA